jgi:alkanesulfonate monooxygenase SsuD/methylene tetrahydromethanopterin reductase-like flavin-dependent oxidoreductase (luciferase family)
VPLSELDELEGLLGVTPTDYAAGPSKDPSKTNDLAGLIAEAKEGLGEDKLTLRDVYGYYVRRPGHRQAYVVGDAVEVADWIEEKFESRALDGITAFVPFLPSPLYDFVDLVIPELQRRGRFRREYEPGTIRERWGLQRPANQFSDIRLAAE